MNAVNWNPTSAAMAQFREADKLIVRGISTKWGKLSENKLGALMRLRSVKILLSQSSISASRASRDVDAALKGEV